MRSTKSSAPSALGGVAAIQCIVGLLGWWLHSYELNWVGHLISFSFLIFVVLAIWARWAPLTPSVIAAGLYGTLLAEQAMFAPELLAAGWIFKAPIVVLLVVAVVSGVRAMNRRIAATATPDAVVSDTQREDD